MHGSELVETLMYCERKALKLQLINAHRLIAPKCRDEIVDRLAKQATDKADTNCLLNKRFRLTICMACAGKVDYDDLKHIE